MININLLVWLVWLITASPTPKKQVLKYTVTGKGDSIGYLTVHQEIHGNRIRYRSLNETKINMLKSFNIRHEVEAVYEGGALHYSEVIVQVNDNQHHHSEVKWDGNQYLIFKEGEKTDSIQKPIHYSSMQLYFQEPKDQRQVFSEQFGRWQSIDLVDGKSSAYILDKKGNKNKYYYHRGQMTYAEVGHWLMSSELHFSDKKSF